MNHLETLLKQIEELREQLHKKASETGVTDPEVITASQMLNSLLNEYHRLLKNKLK